MIKAWIDRELGDLEIGDLVILHIGPRFDSFRDIAEEVAVISLAEHAKVQDVLAAAADIICKLQAAVSTHKSGRGETCERCEEAYKEAEEVHAKIAAVKDKG